MGPSRTVCWQAERVALGGEAMESFADPQQAMFARAERGAEESRPGATPCIEDVMMGRMWVDGDLEPGEVQTEDNGSRPSMRGTGATGDAQDRASTSTPEVERGVGVRTDAHRELADEKKSMVTAAGFGS
ncbi:hypothetical protein N7539_008376 [Penicillium diatomitis]|uniref:Uncharacterized protein n=1 Tax=Penicillium diatomitis TaxID=2819901 RepID=A0A9W9WTQ7_9EURO|nr:uncharacterized protein N7539_008376 [Penicillium diatomitis]KAJ5475310.1 hypothetical protein N7539_008376 [Penicillium diatomitis]